MDGETKEQKLRALPEVTELVEVELVLVPGVLTPYRWLPTCIRDPLAIGIGLQG